MLRQSSWLWMAIGWTMLHFLWLGGLTSVAAALGGVLLRRASAQARYALFLVCFATLAVLPAILLCGLLKTTPGRSSSDLASVLLLPEEPAKASECLVVAGTAQSTAGPRHFADRWKGRLHRVAEMLPWLWILGFPFPGALLVIGSLGAERLRRRARPEIPGFVHDMLARRLVSLKISRRVALGVCDRLATPVVLGVFRPLILLPPAALSGLTPEQVEMILLHELAHVRRWDALVNLLQRVVETLLFFHPAVWWLSGRIRLERECCCDHLVVVQSGRALEYADLIAGVSGASGSPLEPSMALVRSSVVERLRRILGRKPCLMNQTHWVVVAALAAIVPPVVLLSALMSVDDSKLAPATPYYRFLDDGGYRGRLQAAIKTYRGQDGVEVSTIAYLEAAEPEYFAELQRRLASFEAVLHGGSAGYSGPEAVEAPLGEGPAVMPKLSEAAARLEDYLLTGVFGLVWRGGRLDFSTPGFVRTVPDREPSVSAAPRKERSDLELLGEDLGFFVAYVQAKLALETRDGSIWNWWEDLQALAGPRRQRALKFLAAREQTILLNAAEARVCAQSEEDPLPLPARNREILAELRKEIAAGKKKIGLFYPMYLLPELEAHLRDELGLKESGVEWATGWDVRG